MRLRSQFFILLLLLLQLSFHSVAVVFTLVQTKQIIYINETIKYTLNTSTLITKTSTQTHKHPLKNPNIFTPTHHKIHTCTHPHFTKSTYAHMHTLQNPHIHTPTHHKIHTYTHPHFTKSTHAHTHTLQNNSKQPLQPRHSIKYFTVMCYIFLFYVFRTAVLNTSNMKGDYFPQSP